MKAQNYVFPSFTPRRSLKILYVECPVFNKFVHSSFRISPIFVHTKNPVTTPKILSPKKKSSPTTISVLTNEFCPQTLILSTQFHSYS